MDPKYGVLCLALIALVFYVRHMVEKIDAERDRREADRQRAAEYEAAEQAARVETERRMFEAQRMQDILSQQRQVDWIAQEERRHAQRMEALREQQAVWVAQQRAQAQQRQQEWERLRARRSTPKRSDWAQTLGFGDGEVINAASINQKYRRMAMTAHPDRGGSSEAFERITTAKKEALASLPH